MHSTVQIGLVVSAGIDTKIMMNRTSSPRKVPCRIVPQTAGNLCGVRPLYHVLACDCCRLQITQLERHMNILVAIMFGWMLFLAIWLAAGDQIFMRTHQVSGYSVPLKHAA
jgi:magnesium-transporting ATPase (P-type)